MNSSPQVTALTRLLTLNSRVHDLENQLRSLAVPLGESAATHPEADPPGAIAALQEEIDRAARASLVTCWLGLPGEASP